jgi:hypothetical protein
MPAAPESAPRRQFTAMQIEPIRNALENDDFPAAVKCYRQAVPDAGPEEANRYVAGLFKSLRAQHPDMFPEKLTLEIGDSAFQLLRRQNPNMFRLPLMSMATLNWKVMGICALAQAVLLVLWFIMSPSQPATYVKIGAFSLLTGMGFRASPRVYLWWKRLFLLALALAVINLVGRPQVEKFPFVVAAQALGFPCIFFLLHGFKRPRGRRDSKMQPDTQSLSSRR